MNIVFDLDGTLIDSAPDIAAAANATLGDIGVAPLPLAEIVSFIGNGASVLMQRVLAARDLDAALHETLYPAFLARYQDAVDLTVLYPGVREMLDHLAREGHALRLCTNKPVAPTRAVLAHFGLDDTFAAVLGGDSLATRKPDPAPLHATIDALGGGETLYVGDSEIDAATAVNAGIRFALFTGGYRKAGIDEIPHAFLFDHHADLADIVKTSARNA
ncbi:phosphoglycolate phosphatase [Oceaniglobus indicus]|uniref:phosphoglycolate phosphatase n=1 Tax=Oceaniglobus indicus TaxID=2047749 RepID=UPI000C19D95A|nr:phosphoglycolate phosphatase [Oceaniglobus indicus]